MTRDLFWTKNTLDLFFKYATVNRRQEYIVRTRVAGYSVYEQAAELNMSVDQVNKYIKELKAIYDEVQLNHPDLPERMKNKNELMKS